MYIFLTKLTFVLLLRLIWAWWFALIIPSNIYELHFDLPPGGALGHRLRYFGLVTLVETAYIAGNTSLSLVALFLDMTQISYMAGNRYFFHPLYRLGAQWVYQRLSGKFRREVERRRQARDDIATNLYQNSATANRRKIPAVVRENNPDLIIEVIEIKSPKQEEINRIPQNQQFFEASHRGQNQRPN
jgi:hypothetical protein